MRIHFPTDHFFLPHGFGFDSCNYQNSETARFTYDAMGRRQSKTTNGHTIRYVYDGINIVQELDGANATNADPQNIRASYISAGVDRVLARQSPTEGTYHYLTDALGSTTRLTDDNGATLVNYSYDPYGGTKADAQTDNPFQYTGRENDQTGLYYYRARYYSPAYQRFISEDPIGLAGGINVYAYVNGNPLSYTDPLGLAANINLHTGNFYELAETIRVEKGVFTVSAHGAPGIMRDDKNDKWLSPEDLAKMITEHQDYKKGDAVKLYACSTGAGDDSFAKKLAMLLGTNVIAPDQTLFLQSGGFVYSYETHVVDGNVYIKGGGKIGNRVTFDALGNIANTQSLEYPKDKNGNYL